MSSRIETQPRQRRRAIAVSASTLFVMAVAPALLAACGGDDSGGANPPSTLALTQKVQGKMVGLIRRYH